MNDWDRYETLKTKLLGKCILTLFLLQKWIKYIFVLTIYTKKMPGVRVLLWNQLKLLYWPCKEIEARPPGAPF